MELILGDNPFFGVNHRSQSLAQEYLAKKGDFSCATQVVSAAFELGVRRMMVSNHDDLPILLSRIKKDNENASANLKLALVVPYAQKYNQLVAASGVLSIATRLPYLKAAHGLTKLLWSMLFKQANDFTPFIELLLTMELSNLRGFHKQIDTLCLHNIVTDLCAGLGRTELIHQFCDATLRMGMRPVIITQNPLLLDEALPDGVTLCFSYNKLGFMVNPSTPEVQRRLSHRRDYWAMSLLASGALTLNEALSDPYLNNFAGLIYATGSETRATESISRILESIA